MSSSAPSVRAVPTAPFPSDAAPALALHDIHFRYGDARCSTG